MRLWGALENGKKRAIEIAHRRWGKDDVALHRTACAAMERVGTYWHMLPEAAQARKAIWEAVNPRTGKRRIDEAFPAAMRDTTREQEMFIRFVNGSTWQVVGSDNFDSLVGSPPIGVVFSEWALADPRAWAYIRPILAENGGWALFITTPRGPNHAQNMYEGAVNDNEWFAERLPATETNVFTPEQLERELREYIREYGPQIGKAMFDQEFMCSFDAPMLGAFYASLMQEAADQGRIGKVHYERAVKVDTAWDLGMRDSTAIWFLQRVGREIRVIDYLESAGVGLDWYAKELSTKPYVYGEHFLPHDVEVKELGTGRSRLEMLRSLGIGNIRVIPQLPVPDGINAVRLILPRCWFDAEKCQRGILALRTYRQEWDDKLKNLKPTPFHGWESHAADAMRYAAIAYREPHVALNAGDRYARKPKSSTGWMAA